MNTNKKASSEASNLNQIQNAWNTDVGDGYTTVTASSVTCLSHFAVFEQLAEDFHLILGSLLARFLPFQVCKC